MPQLAAFAVAAGKVAIAAAPAIGAGVGVYSLAEQSKARKAAASAAERASAIREQELKFKEAQAGEYFEITSQQMELQAQAGQIQTLANVLERKPPAEPRIITLPAAKSYNPIENLNRAIGKLLRAS